FAGPQGAHVRCAHETNAIFRVDENARQPTHRGSDPWVAADRKPSTPRWHGTSSTTVRRPISRRCSANCSPSEARPPAPTETNGPRTATTGPTRTHRPHDAAEDAGTRRREP